MVEDILYVCTGTFVYGRPNDYVCLGEWKGRGEKSISKCREKNYNEERVTRFFRTNARFNNVADVSHLAVRQTHFLTFIEAARKIKKRKE